MRDLVDTAGSEAEAWCGTNGEKDTDREHGVGVDAMLDPPDGRPDLFEWQEHFYHFPCCACKHVKRTTDECEGCRHFAR